MKTIVLLILIMFVCCATVRAQTLMPALIGNWHFKEVVDASGNALEGTVNPLELYLHKDGSYSMITKSKKVKGEWSEKDSMLYLQVMPSPDSVNHTQVMRILKIEAEILEVYAGAEKGNEIRFIYVRRKKK